MSNTFRKTFFLCFLTFPFVTQAQELNEHQPSNTSKRFIDRVEVFAGPNLSFNYGNKFVENYNDENVKNKRLMKVGYAVGVGVYHPLNKRIDINLRLLYEEKGTNSQMNTPDLEIRPKYNYSFFTTNVTSRVIFGNKNNFSISLGGYFSLLRKVEGYEVVYSDPDIFEEKFYGRNIRSLRADGSVESITYVAGLESFRKYDYGIHVKGSYHLYLKKGRSLFIELSDSFGLQNINILTDGNLPEKNHTIYLILGYSLQRSIKNKP